jgi:hypothetical protein
MAYWLKLGYHRDERADPAHWRDHVSWVNDGPGRASVVWEKTPQPLTGASYPTHGPRYEIGDRLVMYLVEPQCCPAILEVSGVPVWDPDLVDEAVVGHGDRWGVVTPTEYIGAVQLDQAPSLEDIGFAAASLNQGGHRHLTSAQYAEADYRILKRSSGQSPQPPRRRDLHVPIEEGAIEGYDVLTTSEQRKAYRREAKLVDDFAKYLRARGDTVSRNKLDAEAAAGAIYSDLFNESRNQLIEAKAVVSRSAIRMAIGQLADYVRFIEPRPKRAVLLDARPDPDLLDLLSTQGIAVVWRAGSSFADDADGAFT